MERETLPHPSSSLDALAGVTVYQLQRELGGYIAWQSQLSLVLVHSWYQTATFDGLPGWSGKQTRVFVCKINLSLGRPCWDIDGYFWMSELSE